MNLNLDPVDRGILAVREAAREKIAGPRIGDYVLFQTGQLERFSHDLGHGLQTSPGGSIYLCSSGQGSFSGGLNPITPLDALELTQASLPGTFWFFHHGITGAGRGVNFEIVCRVYKTSARYDGFLSEEFQSPKLGALKDEVLRQMAC